MCINLHKKYISNILNNSSRYYINLGFLRMHSISIKGYRPFSIFQKPIHILNSWPNLFSFCLDIDVLKSVYDFRIYVTTIMYPNNQNVVFSNNSALSIVKLVLFKIQSSSILFVFCLNIICMEKITNTYLHHCYYIHSIKSNLRSWVHSNFASTNAVNLQTSTSDHVIINRIFFYFRIFREKSFRVVSLDITAILSGAS